MFEYYLLILKLRMVVLKRISSLKKQAMIYDNSIIQKKFGKKR